MIQLKINQLNKAADTVLTSGVDDRLLDIALNAIYDVRDALIKKNQSDKKRVSICVCGASDTHDQIKVSH